MAKFVYKGHTQSGEEVEKTVEAKDRFAVYEIARKEGNTVSSVSEASSFSVQKVLSFKKLEYFLSRVKEDELVLATRNLGSMLNAGLALSRALSVIERQSKNPRLKGVVGDIRARINKGEQFNEALGAHPRVFNNLYVAMVRAGEEGGNLSESLHTLSVQMKRSSTLRKKIRGAMIYPAIVIIIMIVIGILMMIYVMPSIVSTFEGLDIELPTMTKVLITISKVLNEYTVIVLSGMVLGGGLFVYALRTKYGRIITSWLFPKLPVIGGLVKETNAARTARTLSSLLSSGVEVIRALNITEEVVQNVFYKRIIAEAAVRVEKGVALSEVFVERSDLYPVLVGEMILVGEETGQISEMLQQIALFYEAEVEQKTDNLSTIIEPLLMVLIGGSVGFFALAMITPIYSISDSIG